MKPLPNILSPEEQVDLLNLLRFCEHHFEKVKGLSANKETTETITKIHEISKNLHLKFRTAWVKNGHK